ncbi:ABC transporter ATP-binding protein [Vibrio sp. JC009]|uniref:metal ABC transporter ATP-binding protein n=1 Tax=Vibrio sp. JC009 TaxID=2912314 RepID=UPI0023AF2CBA|nr:ABC transporter ATP-binding protein [Vibrio sp. JC009]WED23840.1 ABC transporter ATP-binding protein [Vibrio sp. JC009]
MNEPHISVEKLSFSYDSRNLVLSDINFSVRRNEIVAFMGPNGGGKTTLFRLLAGLIKSERGKIAINSGNRSASENDSLVGYVPQYARFDKQFPMTVFDVVLSGLVKSFGFYTKNDKKAADQALESIGLTSMKHRSVSELSGGQAQRMLIARALVSPKEILLLDEPTANIDKESSDRLKALITELSQFLTILFVTHDAGFVDNLAHRLLWVNHTLQELPEGSHYSPFDPLSCHPFVGKKQGEVHGLKVAL